GEVVEQQMGGAAFQGLWECLAGANFDFDGESGLASAVERVAHAAGRGDVVVLDQDGIVEAHAVIGDAAGGGGGVEARGGGHAAEALQEVEGNALAGEEGAGAPADGGDDVAIGAAVTST